MRVRRDWRIILEYTAGIVVLVAAVAAAWFLPGLYAQHQDEQLLSEVKLSSRNEIQFLDVNSLEIAGRLKMLEDSQNFGWDFLGDIPENERVQIEKTAREGLKRWAENGLIDEMTDDWVFSDLFFGTVLYLDQGKIPLALMRFRRDNYESEFGVESDWTTVVMDRDNGMLYYVSVSGESMLNPLVRRMGFENIKAFWEWQAEQTYVYSDDTGRTERTSGGDLEEDLSSYNFAAVCGAEASEIEGENPRRIPDEDAFNLSLNVKLKFPNFDSSAYRREVMINEDGGLSIMYGTTRWIELVNGVLGNYGFIEYGHNSADGSVDDYVDGAAAEDEYNKKMMEEGREETEKEIR